jgi:hypothetical protein
MRAAIIFTVLIWAAIIMGAYYGMKHSDNEYWSHYRITHNCVVLKRSLPYAYISDGIDSDGIKHQSVKTMPVRTTWKCQTEGEAFYLEMEE